MAGLSLVEALVEQPRWFSKWKRIARIPNVPVDERIGISSIFCMPENEILIKDCFNPYVNKCSPKMLT